MTARKNPTAKPRPVRPVAAAKKAAGARAAAAPKAGSRKPAARTPARPKPGLFSRVKPRTALRAGLAVVVLGTGLWAWQSGYAERQSDRLVAYFYQASAEAGLKVGNVQVTGRERTEPQEILSVLAVKQGGALLDFDPHAAKSALETLPWVRHATVERRLPDLIVVTLDERRPMALWQLDGQLRVIDEEGQVIPVARVEDYGGLPLVVGPGADTAAAGLIELLSSEPELRAEVVAAVRVGDRRWNIRLNSGIDVKLPEDNALQAWQRLARLDQDEGLLSRDLVVIDLRIPDRLVVQPAPGATVAPPAPPVPGQDT